MASVLYTVNSTTQAVATNGIVSLGSVIHRNCQSQSALSGNGITIVGTGYFTIDVSVTFTGSATGTATLELQRNGTTIQGAAASETIGTADTEIHSVSFTTEMLRPCRCSPMDTITLVNAGVALSVTNVAIRVKRDA